MYTVVVLEFFDTVLQVLFGRISSQETMQLSHIVSLKVCCHSHSDDDDDVNDDDDVMTVMMNGIVTVRVSNKFQIYAILATNKNIS